MTTNEQPAAECEEAKDIMANILTGQVRLSATVESLTEREKGFNDALEWSAKFAAAAVAEVVADRTEVMRQLVERTVERDALRVAIKTHHSQKADDRCILDDDRLYAAAGLPPCDRRVGDKAAMLKNCERFIERRCESGGWPSYAQLEAERDAARDELAELNRRFAEQGQRLREALEPFARFGDGFNACRPDSEDMSRCAKPGSGGNVIDKVITLGDCRRARAALSGQPAAEARTEANDTCCVPGCKFTTKGNFNRVICAGCKSAGWVACGECNDKSQRVCQWCKGFGVVNIAEAEVGKAEVEHEEWHEAEPEDYEVVTSSKFSEMVIGGKKRMIGFCVNSPEAAGYCDDTCIWIADQIVKPERVIEIAIHEGLHAIFPAMDEKTVGAASDELGKLVVGVFAAKTTIIPDLKSLVNEQNVKSLFPNAKYRTDQNCPLPRPLDAGDAVTQSSISKACSPSPVGEAGDSSPPSIGADCQERLKREGQTYPRTCAICGLGPCPYYSEKETHPPGDAISRAKVLAAIVDALAAEREAYIENGKRCDKAGNIHGGSMDNHGACVCDQLRDLIKSVIDSAPALSPAPALVLPVPMEWNGEKVYGKERPLRVVRRDDKDIRIDVGHFRDDGSMFWADVLSISPGDAIKLAAALTQAAQAAKETT